MKKRPDASFSADRLSKKRFLCKFEPPETDLFVFLAGPKQVRCRPGTNDEIHPQETSPMLTEDSTQMQECRRIGVKLLGRPALPLVGIAQFLYLSGPFKTFPSLLDHLKKPVYIDGLTYRKPDELLGSMLPSLRYFEALKKPARLAEIPRIVTPDKTPLNPIKTVEAWVRHQVLNQELETINSKLCTPSRCTLCCTGPEDRPDGRAVREFFEIPLAESELPGFPLDRVDNDQSRSMGANDEPPLTRAGNPFYRTGPALYHWKKGWSLILPRGASCPRLDPESGLCRIYPQRPAVCRKPQIFSYIIEEAEESEKQNPLYILRNKILAVWDCPHVRELRREISAYAVRCGLEPVFMENKV